LFTAIQFSSRGIIYRQTDEADVSLTLLPGKAIEPPTTKGTAMMMVIQLSLETVRDIENLAEAFFDKQAPRFQ